jgi:tetratricopeptide (TPR) repeat protein
MKSVIFFLLLLSVGRSYGQSFNDYATAGFIAERQNNFREALTQYLKAYALAPSNPDINQKVGLMYCYLDKFDSAIFFYSAALQINPKDTLSYYQRGFCYLSNNENQMALDDYVKCSKLIKKVNSQLIFYIGKCCEGLGNWDEAITHFNQALALRPGDKYSLYEIAYCYTLTFDKYNAMKYYNKAIGQDPVYYDAYLNRGLLFESQFKNLDKALEDLQRSIDIKPNNKLSYLYEGKIYNEENQFTKAKELYDKVIDMYPDFGEAYYQRAISWQGLGELTMACSDLDQAEKLGYTKAIEYKKTICK